MEWKVPGLAQAQGTLKHGNGLMKITFIQRETAHTVVGVDQVAKVIDFLGHSQAFFSTAEPLCERPRLSAAAAQPGTGGHRDIAEAAETRIAQFALEGRLILPEEVQRPTIVAGSVIDQAQLVT